MFFNSSFLPKPCIQSLYISKIPFISLLCGLFIDLFWNDILTSLKYIIYWIFKIIKIFVHDMRIALRCFYTSMSEPLLDKS